MYHQFTVEPTLMAVVRHKIKAKSISGIQDPCSLTVNSICINNRDLYSSANVIPVNKSWGGEFGGACDSYHGDEKCVQDG